MGWMSRLTWIGCGGKQPRGALRKWANNTVLLELPEEVMLADPNSYDWHQPVRIQSTEGTNSQYCEDATVCLRRLTEIRDQNDIGVILDDLLNLVA
jgi:hypothetical protein